MRFEIEKTGVGGQGRGAGVSPLWPRGRSLPPNHQSLSAPLSTSLLPLPPSHKPHSPAQPHPRPTRPPPPASTLPAPHASRRRCAACGAGRPPGRAGRPTRRRLGPECVVWCVRGCESVCFGWWAGGRRHRCFCVCDRTPLNQTGTNAVLPHTHTLSASPADGPATGRATAPPRRAAGRGGRRQPGLQPEQPQRHRRRRRLRDEGLNGVACSQRGFWEAAVEEAWGTSMPRHSFFRPPASRTHTPGAPRPMPRDMLLNIGAGLWGKKGAARALEPRRRD